jgi:hypothetical protein
LKKKKGEIIILEFLVSNQGTKMSIRISKTLDKCGCQWSFIGKQPYLDLSLFQLVYLNLEHKNKQGEVCHRKIVVGYQHALG